MPISISDDPKDLIRKRAARYGFDAIGFARVDDAWPAGARLKAFVETELPADPDRTLA